jgi:hypothetical protein
VVMRLTGQPFWLLAFISLIVARLAAEDRDGKDDLGVVVLIDNKFDSKYDFRLLHGRPRDELDYPRDPKKPEDFDATFPATLQNELLWPLRGGRDLTGDGIPEVLIADAHISSTPSQAYVLFGGNLKARAAPLGEVNGSLQITSSELCPGKDSFFCGIPQGLSFAGDVNGDLREDMVIVTLGRAMIYFNPLGPIDQSHHFRRGDSNADGSFDISDAVGILGYLFLGNEEPACLAAADLDDSGQIDISDPIRLLGWLFLGSEPPSPPRECGTDPDGTKFDCRESPCP